MAPRNGRYGPIPTIPPPPQPDVPAADAYYRTGVGDPPHGHDIGAGPWGSHRQTAEVIAKAVMIQEVCLSGATWVYPGRHATAHMLHYFRNTGATYTIDLENMLQFVPSAKATMVREFRHAQDFLFTLPPGHHRFTARTVGVGSNDQAENADWFFGIGGYTRWGRGEATITTRGMLRHYEVDFTYCFYDRYNWDGGKSVMIGGHEITDQFMGEFQRQGLAREFDCVGTVDRRIVWDGEFGAPGESAILQRPGR